MKTLPDNPEFENFANAMRHIMTVPKTEIERRIVEQKENGKRLSKTSASRVPVILPKH